MEGRVTGVAHARYVLSDSTKAFSLAALACGGSVEGSKSDQAVLVGGGWAEMSTANTELENDGSVVLLDCWSICVPSQRPQSCHGRFRNR